MTSQQIYNDDTDDISKQDKEAEETKEAIKAP